jgi:hypothetical protein
VVEHLPSNHLSSTPGTTKKLYLKKKSAFSLEWPRSNTRAASGLQKQYLVRMHNYILNREEHIHIQNDSLKYKI